MKKLILLLTVMALVCALAAQEAQETYQAEAIEIVTDKEMDFVVDDGQEITIVVTEDGETTTYTGDINDDEFQKILKEHDIDLHVSDIDATLAEANYFIAQADIDTDEMEDELNQVRLELSTALDEDRHVMLNTPITFTFDDEDMEQPYMGVYYEEITLDEARELGYDKNFGVRITGVVPNSPARLYRILKDDIIMMIGDDKVLNKKSFSRIIDAHYVGDEVVLTIFRNGEVMDLDFVFGSRKMVISEDTGEMIEPKKRLSAGDGGGSWIPVFFQPDLDDINELVTRFGFSEIDDKGLFLNGLGGKGNVGKGWMLGGMGCWYTLDRKTNVPNVDAIRRMRFSVGYGGVTLDKRIPISRKLITSLGFMLGWGGWSLEVTQTDGNYDWDNLDNVLTNSNNNAVTISKGYIMIQPKAMVMYRILDWLAIRAEVGYMASYSFYSGWKAEVIDEEYEVTGSPDTTFDGMTFTIGPWFGF